MVGCEGSVQASGQASSVSGVITFDLYCYPLIKPRVCQNVLLRDYRRLGVIGPNRYWVHTRANLDYSLCDTYPRCLGEGE